jgi:hypothetical protein
MLCDLVDLIWWCWLYLCMEFGGTDDIGQMHEDAPPALLIGCCACRATQPAVFPVTAHTLNGLSLCTDSGCMISAGVGHVLLGKVVADKL